MWHNKPYRNRKLAKLANNKLFSQAFVPSSRGYSHSSSRDLIAGSTFLIATRLIAALLMISCSLTFAKKTDCLLPYHIHSTSLSYDNKRLTLSYRGNVDIIQGTTEISGDRVFFYLQKNATGVNKLIAYGKPAHYSTLPDNKPHKLYANANKIIYKPSHKIAILIGNAKVKQGENVFSGTKIWYDMANGVVHTCSKKPQKTVLIIQPELIKNS